MSKIKIGDLVGIKWHDAISMDGWEPSDNQPELPNCISVGFVAEMPNSRKKGKRWSLFSDVVNSGDDFNEQVSRQISIPVGMVVKVILLDSKALFEV